MMENYKMMKNYKKPAIEIIEMESDNMLLVGSSNIIYDKTVDLEGGLSNNNLIEMKGEDTDEWGGLELKIIWSKNL